MEVTVYKSVKSRDKTYAGLRSDQILSIVAILGVVGLDILNTIFGVVPQFIAKPIEAILVGLPVANAVIRPNGLTFRSWVKLWWKYTITVQTRAYKQERIKAYSKNDFKQDKKVKESKF